MFKRSGLLIEECLVGGSSNTGGVSAIMDELKRRPVLRNNNRHVNFIARMQRAPEEAEEGHISLM